MCDGTLNPKGLSIIKKKMNLLFYYIFVLESTYLCTVCTIDAVFVSQPVLLFMLKHVKEKLVIVKQG